MNNLYLKNIGPTVLPINTAGCLGIHYNTINNSLCGYERGVGIKKYDLNTGILSSVAQSAYPQTGIGGARRFYEKGFVYYNDSINNHGVSIILTSAFGTNTLATNSLSLINTNTGTITNCALSFPTDASGTGWIASSIQIKNTTLYVVATKKIANTYPSNIGRGIYIFSGTFTTLVSSSVSLTQLTSLTTGVIQLFDPAISGDVYDSGQCTFDNNNNMYITTFNSGIYVCNMTTGTINTTPIVLSGTKLYTSILYNKSNNVLFVANTNKGSATGNDNTIDIYSLDGTPLAVPWMSSSSGYFTGSIIASQGILGFSIHARDIYQMCFDNNDNFYFYSGSSQPQYGIYVAKRVICFKEDTQILTPSGYKLIQDLRKGDLVKTSQNGYKLIYKIGHSTISHFACEERIKDQLYKCSTENFPEVFEDLVLTGCHCILVDKFKDETEREEAKKINMVNANDTDDDFITENKYRLPACIDERTTVYEVEGEHNIYHFALENDDYYMNYGVYANGLLVESTSKRFMDETHMNEITPPPHLTDFGTFTKFKYFTFIKYLKPLMM